MKPLITIFTPAYNRGYTINKCYESLKSQSCKDFRWLIIDDGSTDNTRELVNKWILEETDFEITYLYQENQGMHGAHNTAYENIDTELNICIDSDDYMPIDSVEKITRFWYKYGSDKVAGILALDAYENGDVIGSKFTGAIKESTLFDIYYKHGIVGDKKLIYRTDLTKKFPYPIYEGEKYVGLAYKYYKIDEDYELLLMNEVVCIVEYLEDGSSKNMLRQYVRNPKGFAFYRIENMKNTKGSLKYKFKECIHYVSSSIMSKNRYFINESPCKILTTIALPFGYLLYMYIRKKTSTLEM
ncbi:MAG: glycosyltransferase family 2 protein [Clostridium sp.]